MAHPPVSNVEQTSGDANCYILLPMLRDAEPRRRTAWCFTGSGWLGPRRVLSALTGRVQMLRVVVALFLVLWLMGFVLGIGGNMIHLAVGIALVILIVDFLIRGRRAKA